MVPNRERDSQRRRVYRADKALDPFSSGNLAHFETLRAYVQRVWEMKRVRDAFPAAFHPRWGATPRVRDGRGRRRAGGNSAGITMPLWSRKEGVVLHELAHVICARTHPWSVAGHGWQFCAIYLELVRIVMGADAAQCLEQAFRDNRVRYRAPRKRTALTPEQRAVLIGRLVQARLKAA